ncbi:MAG: DEAD/DEAH box helicase [bacterium]|nr:DEAD/DEAH box helicase [bacterium]
MKDKKNRYKIYMELYAALPPTSREILRLLSVIHEPIPRTTLLGIVQRCGIKNPANGKTFNNNVLRSIAEEMLKTKLVEYDYDGSRDLFCNPYIKETLTREALAEKKSLRYLEAIREIMPLYGHFFMNAGTIPHYIREIRIAIYTSDLESMEELILKAKESSRNPLPPFFPWTVLFSHYISPQLFRALPLHVQPKALEALTFNTLLYLYPPDNLLQLSEYCRSMPESEHKRLSLQSLTVLLIFRGRIGEATELMDAAATDYNSFILRGWLEFLRDNIDDSIGFYEKAIKQYRQVTGKRPAVLPGIGYLFYPLALMMSGDAGHIKTIEKIGKQAAKLSPFYQRTYSALNVYVPAKQGRTNDVKNLLHTSIPTGHDGLSLLVLAQTALRAFPQLLPRLEAPLNVALRNATEGGYSWLVMEYAGLLSRIGKKHDSLADVAGKWSQTIGIRCLALEQTETNWERALEALDLLTGDKHAAPSPESNERLTWMLSPYSSTAHITPKLQKKKTAGGWTGGRQVSLKSLKENTHSCATQQDAAIIRTFVTEHMGYYQSSERYSMDPDSSLPAMVGHPLVFIEKFPQTPVQLVKKEPELVIKQQRNGFKIAFSFPFGESSVILKEESHDRYNVVQISPAQRRIAEIIEKKGLTVPKEGKERLMKTLPALSSLITVQSGLNETAGEIESVEADARIHIRISPLGDGLKLESLVRPFNAGNFYYHPGKGGAGLLVSLLGKKVQTQRDFKLENANLRNLLQACPALSDWYDGSGTWILNDTPAALEILEQLDAVKDQFVPEWPEGIKLKIRKRVLPKEVRVNLEKCDDWFALSGELKVDDELVLSLKQLLEMLEDSPSRFISLGDGEFLALTKAFREQLRHLHFSGKKSGKSLHVHPLSALTMDDFWESVDMKANREWRNLRKRIRKADNIQPRIPSTFLAEMRPYQLEGFKWLSRLAHLGMGACLADDMGLGKTIQALAIILSRTADGPSMVVAPKSVCMNWLNEARRFAPTLNPVIFTGSNREELLRQAGPYDLLICTYGLLHQESENLNSVNWYTIVLDEAQAIKNVSTGRAKASRLLKGDFKLITTGTPIENHPGELWSLFSFINPGLLGSLKEYNTQFAGPIRKDNCENARKRLKKLITPFILRRRKSDVLDELPDKTETTLSVELSTEESAFYEALRRDAVQKISESEEPQAKKRFMVLAQLMKLRRACCHPRLIAPDLDINGSKLSLLGELVDELRENRHKALIFSQFTAHLAVIREYLDGKKISYHYLDGSTSLKERDRRVNAFQAGEGDLFLISLKAGGFGLNLTAANYVIHMDPWWNPAVEDQASDRVHRIGQHQPVTIYRLVTRGTIEEKIVELHKSKRDLADSLLAGTEVSAALTVEELTELIGAS